MFLQIKDENTMQQPTTKRFRFIIRGNCTLFSIYKITYFSRKQAKERIVFVKGRSINYVFQEITRK